MPALYIAAPLLHVGRGSARSPGNIPAGVPPPHARHSARVARSFLRRIRVPFTIREHAVALISHHGKPANLARSGAPAETFLRLACQLNLEALYRLSRAEMAAAPEAVPGERRLSLEAFRQRAQQLGVFHAPPECPLGPQELAAFGIQDPQQAHRAANALRYFRLRSSLVARQWFVERLRQETRRPCGRLVLLIGPAGCGKSSWARQQLQHTQIISSDRTRAELTGDPADQSRNYLVFQRCTARMRAMLKAGESVTFDATNYSEELRRLPVEAARRCGAEIHSYFFDVDLTTVLQRNQQRARRVPEHVIRRHFRLLTPPALYEADQQWVVDCDGEARLYWPVEPEQARSG